ncbi:MAG: hypothetical protein WCI47_00215 [bacterium]
MAKRKKHLKYQAKKSTSSGGRLAQSAASTDDVVVGMNQNSLLTSVTTTDRKTAKADRSIKLPHTALSDDTLYIVKLELRHLLLTAIVIGVLYLLLWVLFNRFGLETKLIQLLKLS